MWRPKSFHKRVPYQSIERKRERKRESPGYAGTGSRGQSWPTQGAIKTLCSLTTVTQKTSKDSGGFQVPVKTIRPTAQASLLAVRKAVFLSQDPENFRETSLKQNSVAPLAVLQGVSATESSLVKTKRHMKRQRANHNKHARREAKAENRIPVT